MTRALVISMLVAMAAAVAAPASAALAQTPPPRPSVIVYGDSLAWEAQDFIAFFLGIGKVNVDLRIYPGTAICDWSQKMAEDAPSHPAAVIVAFSGASLTPCMRDPHTGAELEGSAVVDKYRADSEATLATFGGAGSTTKVWFAGYPVSRAADAAPDGQALRSMYKALPATHPAARWVDAGVLDVTSSGHYTDTLPCLPFEPCQPTRISIVRAPDGAHFCPIPHNDGNYECSMWSSGAFRYGLAMVLPVLKDLGRLP
ncbi:MAG: putative signal peptide-containing protein [Acidimicrobiia bacterium]|nr:putative signal peptide-containing protein [Acidimicrobiia bacterium]